MDFMVKTLVVIGGGFVLDELISFHPQMVYFPNLDQVIEAVADPTEVAPKILPVII
jgi:hypothetical protein